MNQGAGAAAGAAPRRHDQRPQRVDERRRRFSRGLMLAGVAAVFAGNLWAILLRRRPGGFVAAPPRRVAGVDEVPVGGYTLFDFPGPYEPCILLRPASDRIVAFSRRCTHEGCSVAYTRRSNTLDCACHGGRYSAEDGRVLAGPPPRALARVRIVSEGPDLMAVGVETLEADTGRSRGELA
jgi:Rieske Fe-S protein